jgi:hypothetical protein
VFAPEPGVRKFTAREAGSGRLLGFIFFDAVYESGRVAGYYANVTRMRPDAHPGVLNLLVSSFMDRSVLQASLGSRRAGVTCIVACLMCSRVTAALETCMVSAEVHEPACKHWTCRQG